MAEIEIPPYFLCPISLEIMKDPVTVSTGITYDRESIDKWIFSRNNTTCPVTKLPLSADFEFIPNITLRRLIQSWCTLHALERLPTPKPPVTKPQLFKLLDDAVSSDLQLSALQKLRSIASQNQVNKRTMEAAGAADVLAAIILDKTLESEVDSRKACEDSLSILYNLQLSELGIKSLNNPQFIKSLTLIMQNGSYDSRAYAVMLLKSMFDSADSTQLLKLSAEFFSEIGQILKDQISKQASKSALKLLIITCPWGRNRIKAVESGILPALIDLLVDSSDKRTSEMILTVLDLLCQCAEGRLELLNHSAGLAVVSKKILRISQVASERGVRILHSISKFSTTAGVLQEMMQIGVVAKLCLVMQVDCGAKIRERAREILKSHSKAWRNSSCLPDHFISSYPS